MSTNTAEFGGTLDAIFEAGPGRDPYLERYLERRTERRKSLMVPISVRHRDEDDPMSRDDCWLEDFSANGMSFRSARRYELGHVLRVEVNVNHRPWSADMEVVYTALVGEEHKTGLNLIDLVEEEACPRTHKRPVHDPLWLAQAGIDFSQMMKAYHLADITWQQMGRTARRLISKTVEQLPRNESPTSPSERRRHVRLAGGFEADIVVVASRGWRRLPVHIADVSESGVGLLLPSDSVDDPTGTAATGEFILHAGLPVMMALGHAPDPLWLPAEIQRCDYRGASGIHLGVQFLTPASLQFFGA